jgi:hypothetical protein
MKRNHDNKSVKHWEQRPEAKWAQFQFNQPYAKGLKRLREDVLAKTNYDPATLWQWGTMQAMALIEILKAAERTFGAAGQAMVLESLKKIGYDIGRQITAGTTIPEDMTAPEYMSFVASVINKIAYASLETASIDSADQVSFHIDWCPHQDMYQAFDCRVQRYFVQGMLDALRDFAQSQGKDETWDVAFESTIPAGAETCFFKIQRGDPEKTRAWEALTRQLEQKALEIARK